MATLTATRIFVLTAALAALECQCIPATTTSPNQQSASNSSSSARSITSAENHNSDKMSDEVNFVAIMQRCNESNPVTMEYLSELNSTGSFPDEADKGPMCYIQCYLQGIGIINDDGSVNTDRATSMLWPNSADILDDCMKQQDGLFDNDANGACENAYYLTRCAMTKELLATRNTGAS